MLRVESLSVTYGGLRAVDNFSFTLKKNELKGLIGPNGAGKTTVFNALMGLAPIAGGKVVLDGRSLLGKPTHQIGDLGLSRTFQNIRLFKNMTVLDNVKVALHQKNRYNLFDAVLHTPRFHRAEKTIDEDAREILSYFGLHEDRKNLAKNLPYGKQKLLEIARAYATSPQILLLDEPSAGLNETESKELREKVRRLLDENIGILLIEHNMEFVMGVAEHILVMNHGLLIAEGSPDEIRANTQVIEAYLGEETED